MLSFTHTITSIIASQHEKCQEFTSKMTGEELTGRARERWEEIDNEGLDWRSFANGWLEGRIDLMSSKLTKKLDNENTH